jgi:hypothetical protein
VEEVQELELRVHMMEKTVYIFIWADVLNIVMNLLSGP